MPLISFCCSIVIFPAFRVFVAGPPQIMLFDRRHLILLLSGDFLVEDIISLRRSTGHLFHRSLISDQGLNSTIRLVELVKRLNIDHRLSTTYHPQTNGLVERMNRTVKELLTKSITDVASWDAADSHEHKISCYSCHRIQRI
ncbi:hypothetical protein L596_013733 [Steinernema carpocapsae]|uniref:Integrase catalytic domain-containing protein n=1 Tax=Steinernema carpocapsae TaxID=34508 RepID=A0A4U5P120_STECR|nr:hypothetical protein L596_013733 [Steinernema carpocapsae]